ncbi:fimbrial protein [Trabulsiella odontotermitis]|uniref:Fimbrial-type adhesion domain-containing protein n=1 Tax=Trabulsiella odontotermitis TaxID=379893 RepID=A0A0L0GTL9_9ENTR|nr:fimbrial protein [Trabulsiella odontotermitis]KNC91788.1 hypothetical protein GM31_01355 [Trabulsiella odontotermitis]
MKKIFCAAALSTVMGLAVSQSVLADQTGNIHFTGAVTPNTCTLSGQDITHDLGAFSTSDAWTAINFGVFKTISDVIAVSDCSPGESVVMTPTFNAHSGGNTEKMVNDGSAEGVSLTLSKGALSTSNRYSTGVDYTFKTNNDGSVSIPMTQTYWRYSNEQVTAGDINFNATFAFTYP